MKKISSKPSTTANLSDLYLEPLDALGVILKKLDEDPSPDDQICLMANAFVTLEAIKDRLEEITDAVEAKLGPVVVETEKRGSHPWDKIVDVQAMKEGQAAAVACG